MSCQAANTQGPPAWFGRRLVIVLVFLFVVAGALFIWLKTPSETPVPQIMSEQETSIQNSLASARRGSYIEYRGGVLAQVYDTAPGLKELFVSPSTGSSGSMLSNILVYDGQHMSTFRVVARVINPGDPNYAQIQQQFLDQQNYH